MLHYLKIHNLALLEAVELEFQPGFTAITGETGAGKSVLIGALTLLAGDRADKTIIRQGADCCEVEALLTFPYEHPVFDYLEAKGLKACEPGQMIIRRVLYAENPARAWVNGVLVNVNLLKELATYWIDFHGPDAAHRLSNDLEQRSLLDSYSKTHSELKSYQEAYGELQKLLKKQKTLENTSVLSEDEALFYQSQLDKIEAAEVSLEGITALEKAYDLQQKQETIQKYFYTLSQGLGRESGISSHLGKLIKLAYKLGEVDEAYLPLNERLEQLLVEVDDVSYEYAQLFSKKQSLTIPNLDDKMNRWLEVKRLYGPTLEHVLLKKQQLELKLRSQSDTAEHLAQLELAIAEQASLVMQLAKPLSDKRKIGADCLVKMVEALLPSLGLPKARFAIFFEPSKEHTAYGADVIHYLFSSNAGQSLLPLGKVASSGEMARVMLALKVALAESDHKSLLIFDEVDANVGGEVAKAVGQQLVKLASHYQVFAVTHLPQVAAQANSHIVVEKIQGEASVSVLIQMVSPANDSRLMELARMLGDRHCLVAQSHAQELLASARRA